MSSFGCDGEGKIFLKTAIGNSDVDELNYSGSERKPKPARQLRDLLLCSGCRNQKGSFCSLTSPLFRKNKGRRLPDGAAVLSSPSRLTPALFCRVEEKHMLCGRFAGASAVCLRQR